MECQREPVRRIRLTDQALLAVTLARGRAATTGRTATVGDLLVGLAAEPDGAAGRLLRDREHAAVGLDRRALPPGLAPLEVALSWAAADASPRPASTTDLLEAAVEAGGSDLADVLEAVGLPARGLATDHGAGFATETVGLRPPGDPDPELSLEAALAVARTRGVSGGAVELLLAVADGPPDEATAQLPDVGDLLAARARLIEVGAPGASGERWDLGLDHVLDAARTWRAPGALSTGDLVRAALLAGGEGTRIVLAQAERGADA